MNEQEINKKFDAIVQPKIINFKEQRPPAKFPELRYLWGVALIVSFVLIVVASIIQTSIGA